MLVAVFVGLAAARYLGPEYYGVMFFSLTVYAITNAVSTLGFDDIVIRDGLKDKNDTGKIFGTLLVSRTVVIILLYILSIIFVSLKYDGVKLLASVFILSSLLFQPLNVISIYFNMNVQSKYISIAKFIATTISASMKIAFIILKMPVSYFGFAVLIDNFILIAMMFFFFKYIGYSFKGWSFSPAYLKYLIKRGWPLFVIVIISSLYMKINVLMIKEFYSDVETGLYGAAVKLTDIWYNIPILIAGSVFPAIINAKIRDENEFNNRISSLFNLVSFPFIVFALLVTILSPFIVDILLGAEYKASIPVLAVLIWTVPLYAYYTVTMKYLIAENLIFQSMLRPLFALIIVFIFNLIFSYFSLDITYYAVSMVVGSFIGFFLIDVFFSNTRKLFMIKVNSIIFPFIYIKKLLIK